ncbi:hypothetical protein L1987_17882 [Smallanthus sonchifolius]|uniref:Uncharacterized protein n=1 Tax=Smallanthus sonchifolius TaxID=185202 RepID=A0ACB9IYT5_9ASTR|nr:hypothetical protein L1987_17882 [Smallanthus sonchifolius]
MFKLNGTVVNDNDLEGCLDIFFAFVEKQISGLLLQPPFPNFNLQGYAIELYFDPALENQVLKAWNVVARRQISTHLIEIESRPHITLFSSPFIDPSKLENIVKGFASKQDPLPLSFGSIGSLPNDNNVLFLAPSPTLSLLQFHLQLCEAMKREGVEIGEEYRPDSWIPCCPVAQEVPKNRIAEAFTVLRDLKLPVSGYAMDIGLVECSPVRELFSFVLGFLEDENLEGLDVCFQNGYFTLIKDKRHYDDKAAEATQGFWNCPCVPMRERKECHCMLFLTPDNDFAGDEQVI